MHNIKRVFRILGIKRIQLDFEFILGNVLTKTWYVVWWVIPFILSGLFLWAVVTLPSNGILGADPEWLYGTGWGVVIMSIVFIFAVGLYTVLKQEEYYTFSDVSIRLAFK